MGADFLQSGVIPLRLGKEGIEILLVTTSSGRHWTIPKGHIEKGMTPSASAAKEAFEEAGITGVILKPALGFYWYEKRNSDYRVKVFLMKVTKEDARWPEKKRRRRKWRPLAKAVKKLRHKALKQLLKGIEKELPSLLSAASGRE